MDLRAYIPDFGARRHRGSYDTDKCPFHDDSKPSLLIWEKHWECKAGCGKGGPLEWICKATGVDKREAFRILRSEEGIPMPEPCAKTAEPPPEDLPQSLGLKFHLALQEGEREWYRWRGLTNETIDRFQLGFGSVAGRARFTIPVYEYGKLVNVRFRIDDRCPLCLSPWTEDKKGVYTCWDCEHSWIPPDVGGKYIGIQAHNNPRLFNLQKFDSKRVIITEGEFDTMILSQHGFPAVSSTGGAATFLASWGVHFLHYPLVYVVYDNDNSGREGIKKVIELIPKARIVRLPMGNKGDCTDFFREHTRDDFEDLLRVADKTPENCLELRLVRMNGTFAQPVQKQHDGL